MNNSHSLGFKVKNNTAQKNPKQTKNTFKRFKDRLTFRDLMRLCDCCPQ